jgi:hypothetical protein
LKNNFIPLQPLRRCRGGEEGKEVERAGGFE